MRRLQFSVTGTPRPQGSKTGRLVGKRIRVGGQVAVVAPRVILTAGSSGKAHDRLKEWRGRVATKAQVAMAGAGLWTGPIVLECEFVFQRPPSHLRKDGGLRSGKPLEHTYKPDLSKLVRAVEDALTRVIYHDDSQITDYGATRKRWARPGVPVGVTITVSQLGAETDSQLPLEGA